MAIRIYQIKFILKLDSKEFINIPNDLLEMAFRPAKISLNKATQDYLKDTYDGMTNLEDLEFIGDAVLELIATQIVFNSNSGGSGYMTRKRISLVKNTALYCIMQKLQLCDKIEVSSYSIKDCADVFEAIIGALYYYLVYMVGESAWMNILQTYVESMFYTPEIIKNLIENNIELDICKINGHQAGSLGKDYVIKSNTKLSTKLTIEDNKELDRIEHEVKDFPIHDVSSQTKIIIDNTLTDTSWLAIYYNEWKNNSSAFNVLEKIYMKFEISPNVQILSIENNNDWIVLIDKLDFSRQVTVPEYVGIGATKQLALDEAANSALVDIFSYIPIGTHKKVKNIKSPLPSIPSSSIPIQSTLRKTILSNKTIPIQPSTSQSLTPTYSANKYSPKHSVRKYSPTKKWVAHK